MTAAAPLDLAALLDDLERAHAAIGDSPAFRVVGYVQDDENPEWVLARFADEGTSVFAECYGADAAALIVAAVNAVPTLIAELRKRDAALRAVEEVCGLAEGRTQDLQQRLGLPPIPRRVSVAEVREALRGAALSPESVRS